jgi:hypothetical protein
LSEPPQRRKDDGAIEFIGGPRDGDRMPVEGRPPTVSIPDQIERGKGSPPAAISITYELRDGAYHYVSSVGHHD